MGSTLMGLASISALYFGQGLSTSADQPVSDLTYEYHSLSFLDMLTSHLFTAYLVLFDTYGFAPSGTYRIRTARSGRTVLIGMPSYPSWSTRGLD